MKKIFVLCLFLIPIMIYAFSVSASVNKTTLSLNDRLEYTIKISHDGSFSVSEPKAPEIQLFSFVSMSSSSSASTNIVGFKSTSTHSKTFSYYYIPKKTGTTTIPAQPIKIGNKVYTTQSFVVTVQKVTSSTPSQGTNSRNNPSPFWDPQLPWSADRMVGSTTLLAMPSNKAVFKGQPTIVSYYLYTDQMVRSFSLEDEKDFPGYGKSIYEQPSQLVYESVAYQGKRFQRALIKRLVILPNETGTIKLPVLSGIARIYEFGYLSQNITSNTTTLEVKPLPKDSVPASFTGAVGSFQITENLSAKEINLGEALTLTLRINGKGNFNQFSPPPFQDTRAQISSPVSVDKLNAGIEGSRFLYYTIIPSEKGNYSLPSLSFSWFDPATGSYHKYQSPEMVVKVKASNVISYFSGLLDGNSPRTINPMLSRQSYPAYISYFHSFWYWLMVILISTLGAVSAYFAWHKKQQYYRPAEYAKKMANKALQRHFSQASVAAANNSREFYALAEHGLLTFLAEKYEIPNRLSIAEKIAALKNMNIEVSLVAQTEDFLQRCNLVRFAPGDTDSQKLQSDLAALKSLVNSYSKLSKEE